MKDIQTKALHAGSLRPRNAGAVVTPVYFSSTFEYHGESYHDVKYLRLSTSPNHQVLGERIAALEGTEAALVTGSGMAAISGTLMSLLNQGDHVLVQDCLYGGTIGFLNNDLSRYGVEYTVIDVQKPETWESAVRPTTRALYVESLTNPLVQIADLPAVAQFAQAHGIKSVIDNTFASPINFRPAEIGFDYVVESCTKYMSGHNDLIAGSVAGAAEDIRKVKLTLDHLGGYLDPHGCFLLERGLKTLALRVSYQNQSALTIAKFLNEHPAVREVHYPGLAHHPQHQRAAELFRGFGGMMSFEVQGGMEGAEALLPALKLPAVAASLGGADSLIVRPAAAVHSGLSAEERERSGITDGLIRFSVGLEATEDLLGDLQQAFTQTSAAVHG